MIFRHDRQARRVTLRTFAARESGDAGQPSREWIGGRLSSPMFIHDRDEPYRPEFVVWMELPDQHIVGHAVVMPEDTEGAVARTLRRALSQPAAGSPRQPDVIRVAEATIAAEVRAEVAGTIPVEVAPTPELDELLDHMQAAMPEVPRHRTRTPRECPEGSAPEGDRPTVFGTVSRLGWPPERRGYALAWLLSPRNEHWRDASAGKKAHE